MITTIQPLYIGNALRLFIQPPVGAVLWKILRKGSPTFSDHQDGSALVVYEGNEVVFIDAQHLKNEVKYFYCPFYSSDHGATWTAGAVSDGTPLATYEETTTDVLTELRTRLEAGLMNEVQRGNFTPELGYIQVYTAPPSLDQGIRLPVVTVHLDDETPMERGVGEYIGGDEFSESNWDWSEGEGWLAHVRVVIIAWALNSDERLELRKAIRRLIVGNLPVFESYGWMNIDLNQQDVDALNGEYQTQLYQVMNTFTCTAPVCVSGRVAAVSDVGVLARSDG